MNNPERAILNLPDNGREIKGDPPSDLSYTFEKLYEANNDESKEQRFFYRGQYDLLEKSFQQLSAKLATTKSKAPYETDLLASFRAIEYLESCLFGQPVNENDVYIYLDYLERQYSSLYELAVIS